MAHGGESVRRIDLGGVNCYLIKLAEGYIIVDSGGRNLRNGPFASIRSELDLALAVEGCTPATLRLVIISHGHFDHTGNAAYLRARYGAKIAMHPFDAWMASEGRMPDRHYRPFPLQLLSYPLMLVARPRLDALSLDFEPFSPDILIDEGFDLSPFGWDARVLFLPGHSRGSIGIITGDKDLFSGDILSGTRFLPRKPKPGFNRNMADESFQDLDASIARVRGLSIRRVYPGHGESFAMSEIQSAF